MKNESRQLEDWDGCIRAIKKNRTQKIKAGEVRQSVSQLIREGWGIGGYLQASLVEFGWLSPGKAGRCKWLREDAVPCAEEVKSIRDKAVQMHKQAGENPRRTPSAVFTGPPVQLPKIDGDGIRRLAVDIDQKMDGVQLEMLAFTPGQEARKRQVAEEAQQVHGKLLEASGQVNVLMVRLTDLMTTWAALVVEVVATQATHESTENSQIH